MVRVRFFQWTSITEDAWKTLTWQFFVDKLGPFMVTDLLRFFNWLPFLLITLNLAYFASLNGVARIFSVSFSYQRCLENFNMINFWSTSWVTLLWQISFSFFLLHFLPRTRVCNKEPLINTGPKYYFKNTVIFLETTGKKLLISDPRFVYIYF